jgi:altronate hydrolase
LKAAFEEKLGYKVKANNYISEVEDLIGLYKSGADVNAILSQDLLANSTSSEQERLFKNVDGIKF